jgi:hypothetical protein
LHAEVAVWVQFHGDNQSSSHDYGPFEGLTLVDGVMRHGPGLKEILAQFGEDAKSWYVHPARTICAIMLLAPA